MHPNNEPKCAGLRRVDARRLEAPAFSVLQRNCHGALVCLAVGRTSADARLLQLCGADPNRVEETASYGARCDREFGWTRLQRDRLREPLQKPAAMIVV